MKLHQIAKLRKSKQKRMKRDNDIIIKSLSNKVLSPGEKKRLIEIEQLATKMFDIVEGKLYESNKNKFKL